MPQITVQTDSGTQTLSIDVSSARIKDNNKLVIDGTNTLGDEFELIYTTDNIENSVGLEPQINSVESTSIMFSFEEKHLANFSKAKKK